ncbi:MAG: ribonuclease P protein component [Ruminococcaceae bacterium]|nr:ribonuclease P protein component [Oscillospiraceae bacterium]
MMKIVKLKENRDFRRVYNKGKSFVCPYFVVYINKNRGDQPRLGITVSKKIGNAVKRNRAKRVITAAFSTVCPKIISGYDFVIVARTRILDVKSTVVTSHLFKFLDSFGVLKPYQNEKDTD